MINVDLKKYKIVPIDSVFPNAWNPKDKETEDFEKIKQSIEENGLMASILVRPLHERESEAYEIIDGEQRWTACKELGFDHIVVYDAGEISNEEAQRLTIYFEQQVPFNEIKLGDLVNEMLLKNPSVILPFSKLEMDKFAEMKSFDWDNYKKEDVDFPEVKKTLSVVLSEPDYEQANDIINSIKNENNCDFPQAFMILISKYQ